MRNLHLTFDFITLMSLLRISIFCRIGSTQLILPIRPKNSIFNRVKRVITWGPKYNPSLIWHLYFQIHIENSMTFFLVCPRVFRRSVDDTSHLFVRPIHYGFANFDIGKARYKWGGQVEIRILVGNNSIVTSYVASKGHVHVCLIPFKIFCVSLA